MSSYLLQKEQRQTQAEESSVGQEDSALAAQVKRKGKWKRISMDPSSKYQVACFYCHKVGHMKKDCRKPQFAISQQTNQVANVAAIEEGESEEYALVASYSQSHTSS